MTHEETIYEKAQWWKAGRLSGSDASFKAVIGYEIKVAIESAILAEREACALMAQHWGAMMNDADPRETLPAAEFDRRYGHSDLPDAIRARSNAPESPKENAATSDCIQWKGHLIHGPIVPEAPNKPQVGFFGLNLSSGKAKEEKIAPDPVSA